MKAINLQIDESIMNRASKCKFLDSTKKMKT